MTLQLLVWVYFHVGKYAHLPKTKGVASLTRQNAKDCLLMMIPTQQRLLCLQDTLNLIAAVVQAVLNGVLLYQTLKTFYASRGTVEDPPPQEVGPAKAA